MTTTEARPAAPPVRPRPPVVRGPLVAAAVVLLLWGVWLLVPHGTRLELLGGTGADAAAGAEPAGDPGEGPDAAGREVADRAGGPDDAAAGPAGRAADARAAGADPEAGADEAADPEAGPVGAAGAGQADPAPVEVPQAGDGTFVVAPGEGPVVGDGELVRYTVEVEGGVPVDVDDLATTVEAVLADPRSWTAQGRWSLQRVADDPDARIVVASPDTTDRMCAPLRTRGEVSCRNGADVVLNAVRWTQGARSWGSDVTGYRQYVVNHELGHFLGNGHVRCPEPGTPAPVMLQQTIGLQGCLPNAWPYP